MANDVPITGTIGPTPQNATLAAIARALRFREEAQTRLPRPTALSMAADLMLPTSATVEKWSYGEPLFRMPSPGTGGYIPVPTTDKEYLAESLGMAPVVAPLSRGVNRAAQKAGDVAVRAITRNPQATAQGVLREAGQMAPLASVIKPKGGNWLRGADDVVRDLKSERAPILSGEIINDAAGRDLFSEYRQAYQQDPTVGLHDWMRKNHPDVYAQIQNPEDRVINKWLDQKLTKYIKNEMGTPEDPVRALAERGVLHFQPEDVFLPSGTAFNRTRAGFPRHGTSENQLAIDWEVLSDSAIAPNKAGDVLSAWSDKAIDETAPWLRKVPPETPVYDIDETKARKLGLDHLVDELKNAMAPNSTLPQSLRLTPEKLDKVTMPQAVELVDKINKWRSAEAAKAERLGMMENLKAAPRLQDDSLELSFVEKPGAKWVDIPETVNDEGYKLCTTIGKQGGWCTQQEWAAKEYGSGKNRLVAMLDAEGRPHVQAKVTSTKIGDVEEFINFDEEDLLERFPQLQDDYYRFIDEVEGDIGYQGDFYDWLSEFRPKKLKALTEEKLAAPDITELKPVANTFGSERGMEYQRRDPAYKEKVTQSVLKFLNNGNWGRVQDLHHYNIVDIQDTGSVVKAVDELYEGRMREFSAVLNDIIDNSQPGAVPRFMTKRQLRELIGPMDDVGQNFAEGGAVPGYAGGGLFTKVAESIGELAAKYGTKAAPKEHKMLQGVYRGYAGEDPGETVFHAGAEFQRPNPGLFTNPERAAVEQFQQAMGSPKLHTFEAKPRRTGTDEDVYAMARRLGIYNPGIPASQYLEQGENAIFPEAARMVEELRGMGLDSLRLKDGMGKQPSLVALDPGVVRPAESVFASPQRRVAEYYAQKRAAQTGERPHVEMLLVDPFAGKKYGHSIPMDKFNREPVTTRARKLQPEQVKNRTKLYAAGGAVQFDPDEIAHLASQAMHGYAEGGAVKYDPSEIEQLVAQMREEFHA